MKRSQWWGLHTVLHTAPAPDAPPRLVIGGENKSLAAFGDLDLLTVDEDGDPLVRSLVVFLLEQLGFQPFGKDGAGGADRDRHESGQDDGRRVESAGLGK